ncbi:hypothetical protein [Burkholderia ubonensis]|uniref:hypothetical protein n=1 Tax=Burkholderia ubonensis TaxID=101571 RepID=UPI000B32CA94|nr:hypothetical protein [Burkholderia ubonensis]
MSFERLAFQSWIENYLGCNSLDQWDSYRQKVEQCVITPEIQSFAISALGKDAGSLLHKGILSFLGACSDIRLNSRSWAIVKLYYSLFYTVRARLCSRKHGLVRNRSWYHFNINLAGAVPVRLNGRKDRYRNDHECALHLYEDIFDQSDALISNLVDGEQPFAWMMEMRNIANYRLARFPDPEFPLDITSKIGFVDEALLERIVGDNIADSAHTLMFQPEHAWIAIPVKQIIAAHSDLVARGQSITLPADQYEHTLRLFESSPKAFRESFDLKKIFVSE